MEKSVLNHAHKYAIGAVLVGFNRDIKTSRSSTRDLLTQPHPAQGILVGNFATVSQIIW